MLGVLSKDQGIKSLQAKALPPPIPLITEPVPELKKHEFINLDLKFHPGHDALETYSLNMHFFNSGTPSDWIDWHKIFEKVVIGHSLTDGPDKCNMVHTLLHGDTLQVFNQATINAGAVTNEHLQEVIEAVTKHVFPA